ncbi:hypothetical protein B0A52_04571 [Exophiala mesophila]|uniref:Inactive metallocarboxypeptidase ECM14 n=1 Tax=Exophiala mesophila TaxID=212818 RepID=A0A438N877_EXOME|nr:hypothetical protein B0A52_04571 [Exophiala mesophila]
MAPVLQSIAVLLSLVSPSICISLPTPDSTEVSHHPRCAPHFSDDRPVGLFRRLRNTVIEKIWSLPPKSSHPPSSILLSNAPQHFRTRYGNDVVLRFRIRSADEAKTLADAAAILLLDVWEGTDEWVDIRVAKDMLPSLMGLLPPSLHDSYTPLMHDLAQAVFDTYPTSSSTSEHDQAWVSPVPTHSWKSTSGPPQDLFFHDYQPLSVLYPWLRLISSLFPTHAELISIGKSAEGRDIPALRIGTQKDYIPQGDHDSRQTLVISGGSHAREWISVSTTAYIAYSLVTRYGHRYPHVTKLLDHFDLVFIPALNPDGYEYTWTTDRLWRKNRQSTDIPFCPGIDIDRSFGFGWDGHTGRDNACSDDYAGTGPLGAVEARILSDWARNQTENNNVTFVAYLDLHSYSQEVLYPYSYTCDVQPPNLEDLEEVAMGLAKSFRLTNGHYYGVESACEGSITFQDKATSKRMQGEQGGSALDFFYHDLQTKFAYQIKLRDTGTYGFLLPRSHIVPTGEEAYEAVLGLGRWLLGNHGIEKFDDLNEVWGTEEAGMKDQEQGIVSQDPVDVYDKEDEDVDPPSFELRRRRRR